MLMRYTHLRAGDLVERLGLWNIVGGYSSVSEELL